MAEYRIVSRGESYAEWVRAGWWRLPADFVDLLGRTPEPLLAEPGHGKLLTFLKSVPATSDRRSVEQCGDGMRLAGLVKASKADALVDEAKSLLCTCLRGESLLGRGRPRSMPSLARGPDAEDSLALHVFEVVERHFARPGNQDVVFLWGPVPGYAEFDRLPAKAWAWATTRQLMLDKGYTVAALPRFRNRVSAYRTKLRRQRNFLNGRPGTDWTSSATRANQGSTRTGDLVR